jgi:hypothetical protein
MWANTLFEISHQPSEKHLLGDALAICRNPDFMMTYKNLRLPRTVFTICTGRCGTQLLSERLAALPGVDFSHEPDPNFVDVMPAASRDRQAAQKFLLDKKLLATAASGAKVYVKTSHVFGKGFPEPLIDLGVAREESELSGRIQEC